MKWNRLYKESMDADVDLRNIIKRDPTEFALAMRIFMSGLVEMGNEKGIIDAIQGISNNEIAMALFKIENEEWDRFANED